MAKPNKRPFTLPSIDDTVSDFQGLGLVVFNQPPIVYRSSDKNPEEEVSTRLTKLLIIGPPSLVQLATEWLSTFSELLGALLSHRNINLVSLRGQNNTTLTNTNATVTRHFPSDKLHAKAEKFRC